MKGLIPAMIAAAQDSELVEIVDQMLAAARESVLARPSHARTVPDMWRAAESGKSNAEAALAMLSARLPLADAAPSRGQHRRQGRRKKAASSIYLGGLDRNFAGIHDLRLKHPIRPRGRIFLWGSVLIILGAVRRAIACFR
jgi:hypothetical protein